MRSRPRTGFSTTVTDTPERRAAKDHHGSSLEASDRFAESIRTAPGEGPHRRTSAPGSGGHLPTEARRAEASSLIAKRHEPRLVAAPALEPCEPMARSVTAPHARYPSSSFLTNFGNAIARVPFSTAPYSVMRIRGTEAVGNSRRISRRSSRSSEGSSHPRPRSERGNGRRASRPPFLYA